MVLLVGSIAFENDIAWKAILDKEAELGLVKHILLRPKVDLDRAGQELLFKLVLWHRWHYQAFWHLAQRF